MVQYWLAGWVVNTSCIFFCIFCGSINWTCWCVPPMVQPSSRIWSRYWRASFSPDHGEFLTLDVASWLQMGNLPNYRLGQLGWGRLHTKITYETFWSMYVYIYTYEDWTGPCIQERQIHLPVRRCVRCQTAGIALPSLRHLTLACAAGHSPTSPTHRWLWHFPRSHSPAEGSADCCHCCFAILRCQVRFTFRFTMINW